MEPPAPETITNEKLNAHLKLYTIKFISGVIDVFPNGWCAKHRDSLFFDKDIVMDLTDTEQYREMVWLCGILRYYSRIFAVEGDPKLPFYTAQAKIAHACAETLLGYSRYKYPFQFRQFVTDVDLLEQKGLADETMTPVNDKDGEFVRAGNQLIWPRLITLANVNDA